jgi:hypothetical protein
MNSLYDVFCAIRADEGDHVSTMQACLDPEATLRSPSLEKRVLAGVALAAAVGFLLSTGDMVDITGDATLEDGFAATGVVESVVAGVSNFAQQIASDEQEGNMVGLSADAMEAGKAGAFMGVVRQGVMKVALEIARIIAVLL